MFAEQRFSNVGACKAVEDSVPVSIIIPCPPSPLPRGKFRTFPDGIIENRVGGREEVYIRRCVTRDRSTR